MIQRIQSFWLLLAAVASFATIKFPVFAGMKPDENHVNQFQRLTGAISFPTLLLSAIVGSIALIAIFLYKDRKLQIRITWIAFVLCLLNLVLYYLESKKFVDGNYSLTAVIAITVPIFIGLALRGIRHDEKLIKGADRLR